MASPKIVKGKIHSMTLSDLLSLANKSEILLAKTSYAHTEEGERLHDDYVAFHNIMSATRSKASTSLSGEDSAVDLDYTAVSTIAEINSKSPDPEVAAEAQKINNILSSHKNPTRLSYDKAYSTINLDITCIDALDVYTLEKAGVKVWYDQLKIDYTAFNTRWSEINELKTNRVNGVVNAARQKFEASYLNMIDYLNYKLKFSPNEELLKLADWMNEMIGEFITKKKSATTRTATSASAKKAESASSAASSEAVDTISAPVDTASIDDASKSEA